MMLIIFYISVQPFIICWMHIQLHRGANEKMYRNLVANDNLPSIHSDIHLVWLNDLDCRIIDIVVCLVSVQNGMDHWRCIRDF